MANAQLTGKNLLPVLDLEDSGGLGVKKLKRWTKAWLDEVQAQARREGDHLHAPSFWKTHMGNSRWFADNGYQAVDRALDDGDAAHGAGGQLGRPRLDAVAVHATAARSMASTAASTSTAYNGTASLR